VPCIPALKGRVYGTTDNASARNLPDKQTVSMLAQSNNPRIRPASPRYKKGIETNSSSTLAGTLMLGQTLRST